MKNVLRISRRFSLLLQNSAMSAPLGFYRYLTQTFGALFHLRLSRFITLSQSSKTINRRNNKEVHGSSDKHKGY